MVHTTAPVSVRLDDLQVVATTIDGKGPYHFVLDTGAAITVITPELARRAGLQGTGSGQVTGTATVQVKTLRLKDVGVALLVRGMPAFWTSRLVRE
jgi:predicted aspartyl protease